MTTKAAIDEFMALKKLAVAGASRNVNKFGYQVYRELVNKGYTVYPINPNAETIDGAPCYASVAALPERPDGLILVTPPAQSAGLVREAVQAGITHVWLQQGAFTPEAVEVCRQNGVNYIAGECIFMFSEPAAWFHRAHRWINTMVGKAPQ